MIDWLFPTHRYRDPVDDEAQEREAIRQAGRDAAAEVAAFVREMKAAAADDRNGFPIENAMRRRRPS